MTWITVSTLASDDIDNWSRQAQGFGEDPNAPDASFKLRTVRDGDRLERIARDYGGDNWRAQQALILRDNPIGIDPRNGNPTIRPGDSLLINDLGKLSSSELAQRNQDGGAFTARNYNLTEADAVRNLYAYANGTQAERFNDSNYVFARDARDVPHYGFPLTNQFLPETSSGAVNRDIEIKAAFGLYAGFGGDAEITIKFNLYDPSFSVEEFEAGLGVGAGVKYKGQFTKIGTPLHPDGDSLLTYTLAEPKFGKQQTNNTIAIGTKIAIEGQIGPIQGGGDLKAAVESPIGGGKPSTFTNGQLTAKIVTGLGFTAMAKWNLFNWDYKK